MAITDDIALYALGYMSAEGHPSRVDALCLNTVQRKTPCGACTEACPVGIVLHEGEIDWHSCVDCGLCAAACPTQALSASSAHWTAVESAVDSQSSYVTFACECYAGKADVVVSCLAALPCDELVAVALRKTLVIKTAPCKACRHADRVSRVKELVSDMRSFLGTEEFSRRVFPRVPSSVLETERMEARKGAERRRAFSAVTRTVRHGAVSLVSQDSIAASRARAFLVDALLAESDSARPALGWKTLVEDGRCEGCGICVKMCPHHALSLRKDDAACENGSLAVSLDHDASLCTACGLCYMSCPHENLGGWDELRTSDIPAVRSNPIHVDVCEKCGRYFRHEEGKTRCAACSRFRFRPPART